MNDKTAGRAFTPAPIDGSKRAWLITTSVAGAAGTVALAAPFAVSFAPSEKARAAGAPVEADISELGEGHKMTVAWRGKPVWILRRTQDMLDTLPQTDSLVADPDSKRNAFPIPDYAKNEWRAREDRKDILVLIGICTHLGCVPDYHGEIKPEPFDPQWVGGFYCPCHKSRFDISARVFDGVPAPTNLVVPPYHFIDDTHIVIGVDPEGAA